MFKNNKNNKKDNMKVKSYKVISSYLTDYHGFEITKDNLYKKNNCLFVDLNNGTIEVYNYPINEYFEPLTHLLNYSKRSFNDFVNNDVDFSTDYPTEKRNFKTTPIESNGKPIETKEIKVNTTRLKNLGLI